MILGVAFSKVQINLLVEQCASAGGVHSVYDYVMQQYRRIWDHEVGIAATNLRNGKNTGARKITWRKSAQHSTLLLLSTTRN